MGYVWKYLTVDKYTIPPPNSDQIKPVNRNVRKAVWIWDKKMLKHSRNCGRGHLLPYYPQCAILIPPLFAVEYDLIWCEHMLSKLMLKTKHQILCDCDIPLPKKTRFRRSLRWKWWRCRALRKVNWERSLQWKGSCWHMSHLCMPPWIYPPHRGLQDITCWGSGIPSH